VITLDQVRRALSLPLPGLPAQLRMSPPDRPHVAPPQGASPRQAGVLLLLYPRRGALHFVLTRRTERLGTHSGQISLPGGRREPHDADLTATALREANEELGVELNEADVLGHLTDLYVPPSHFMVYPTVASLDRTPVFHPQPGEVAEIIETPVAILFDPEVHAEAPRALVSLDGRVVSTPFYRIGGQQVWGATAMILSEFEALLQATL
jgi:8-oxo-dGTP pyrophosphatase MutT (NUDIX family)